MIELIDSTVHLIAAGICAGIAFTQANRLKDRAWVLLGLFSAACFLGDLYWNLYLIFYQKTPHYSHIPDLCWYTSYIFLLMLLTYVRRQHRSGITPIQALRRTASHRTLWLIPVFTVGMCIFYMQRGDYLGNIITVILMTALIAYSADGLIEEKQRNRTGMHSGSAKALCIVSLLMCFAEYGMWTASRFWAGDTITNSYFWFDSLMSLTFLMFPSALRKAVA